MVVVMTWHASCVGWVPTYGNLAGRGGFLKSLQGTRTVAGPLQGLLLAGEGGLLRGLSACSQRAREANLEASLRLPSKTSTKANSV
jgi:hypothetical protein